MRSSLSMVADPNSTIAIITRSLACPSLLVLPCHVRCSSHICSSTCGSHTVLPRSDSHRCQSSTVFFSFLSFVYSCEREAGHGLVPVRMRFPFAAGPCLYQEFEIWTISPMEWTRGRRQGTRSAHPYEWPKMSFFPEEACELSYAMAWLSAALTFLFCCFLYSLFFFFSVPRACSFFYFCCCCCCWGEKKNEEEEEEEGG